ncbi:S-layer homology domain-containing protein [Paenibacillus gallinarum]|uniref:S-layer homology domain-containing protein n=1 Tax=Paenibacillus gallinarum TaxID=2762232 RepID=A0ABR8T3P2_9BACL|nr:S-layer homology domain-containing protein [Paenibacillus gallinarum]MBD7970373.1 S-layer homology domain-containing protein [Paenibacillus gallinarum]
MKKFKKFLALTLASTLVLGSSTSLIDGGKVEAASGLITPEASIETVSVPQNVRKVSSTFTSNTIAWDAVEGATSYKVKVDIGSYKEVTGTSYTDITAYVGGTKTYVVRAVKDGVESIDSASLEIKTGQIPDITNAEAGVVGSNRVDLGWDAIEGITDYVITRNDGVIFFPKTNSYSDITAKPGVTYTYEVEAQAGNSFSKSASVEVTTKPALTFIQNLRVVSTALNSITLAWDAQEGADGYEISMSGATKRDKTEETSFTVTGLAEATNYDFKVWAVSGKTVGGSQGVSGTTKSTTLDKLPAPSNFVAEKVGTTTSKVKWNAVDGADEYVVKRNGMPIGIVLSTWISDKDLMDGTTYTYKVAAIKDGVEGEFATLLVTTLEEDQVEIAPAPVAPSTFTAVKGNSKEEVLLSWDGSNETLSVILTADGLKIAELSGTENYYKVLGKLGQTVKYGVSVLNVQGTRSPERTVIYTFPVGQVTTPRTLTLQDATYKNVALSWEPTFDADSYELYRDGQVIMAEADETYFEDTTVEGGRRYVYSVKAVKDGNYSAAANRVVNTPNAPEEGVAPEAIPTLKVLKAYSDRVNFQIDPVPNATKYEVFRDGLKVYEGSLNLITDATVTPSTTYNYTVKASNAWGEIESDTVSVTTPAVEPIIQIEATEVKQGTLTMSFKEVDTAEWYEVARNPEWKITLNGDGTYHLGYYNEVTLETKDYGNYPIVDGEISFFEEDIESDRNYRYEITAIKRGVDGTPEVIGISEITVSHTEEEVFTPPTDNDGNTGGNIDNDGSTGGNTGGSAVGGGSSIGGGTVGGSIGDTTGEIVTPEDTTVSLTDIKDHYAENEITFLVKEGIIKGYEDGTFAPNKEVSRAEFAIMLKRAMGYESAAGTNNGFNDLDAKAWYATELSVALSLGITKGYNDGTYRPNAKISRQEASIMISNVLMKELKNPVMTKAGFKDYADITTWASDGVNLASSYEIVKGYADGKFYPKKNITRAETAVMIYRLLEVLK